VERRLLASRQLLEVAQNESAQHQQLLTSTSNQLIMTKRSLADANARISDQRYRDHAITIGDLEDRLNALTSSRRALATSSVSSSQAPEPIQSLSSSSSLPMVPHDQQQANSSSSARRSPPLHSINDEALLQPQHAHAHGHDHLQSIPTKESKRATNSLHMQGSVPTPSLSSVSSSLVAPSASLSQRGADSESGIRARGYSLAPLSSSSSSSSYQMKNNNSGPSSASVAVAAAANINTNTNASTDNGEHGKHAHGSMAITDSIDGDSDIDAAAVTAHAPVHLHAAASDEEAPSEEELSVDVVVDDDDEQEATASVSTGL
jgi:hypothetical protein